MSALKRSRAQSMSTLGPYHESFSAMWRYLPDDVVAALPSPLIAKLIERLWACAEKSKVLAEREVVRDGGVWDERSASFREIGPARRSNQMKT